MRSNSLFSASIASWLSVVASALPLDASPESDPSFCITGNSATPIPPKQDPWYQLPAVTLEDLEPGHVLQVRPAPGNLTCAVGNASAAWNIMYRTTGSRYQPTWAVTTLFAPLGKPDGNAVLSYQTHYDSADLNASPSFSLYQGAPEDIAEALGRGWYVAVPDYEGPLASFTAGVMSGHATIDSIRAIASASGLLETGISRDARYAMWGYSGGALASEWAAELLPDYAPELRTSVAGAALGGLTPNVTSVLQATNKGLAAGLIPPSILGAISQFPDVEEFVLSQLRTEGTYNAAAFLATRNYSLSESILAFLNQDISQYFMQPNFALLDNAEVQAMIQADGIMGTHGVPTMPLFVYKAIKDEVSPVRDTDELVDSLCRAGANITYERNEVGGHSAEEANGQARAFAWLADILRKQPEPTPGACNRGRPKKTPKPLSRCETRNVTVDAGSDSPLRKRRWYYPVDI